MITIENLSISLKNKSLVYSLNLDLNQGEFWAILGKNGTGKTTLLHTLAGFKKYNSGNIKIKNQELNSINPLSKAQNISLLSQRLESGLNCTVKQSVSYGRYPWHNTEIDDDSDNLAINKAIDDMQLNKIKNESIQQISGGELRKVEIATVLAQDSEIMMLDEPLNHLDIAHRYKLMELLKQLSNKKLIIIVTHDIQYVQAYCSHVIMILDDGKTITGTTKEIINHNNLNETFGITLPNTIYN